MNKPTTHRNSCKRRRAHIVAPMKAFYLNCGLCMVAVQHSGLVSAFAPIKENNKCEGPLCPRRLSMPSTGKGAFASNNSQEVNSPGDSFAVRMASHQREEIERENDDYEEKIMNMDELNSEAMVLERRKFLEGFFAVSAATLTLPMSANAYEKAYPVTLDFENNDSTINLQSIREDRIAVQKSRAKQSKSDIINQPLAFRNKEDVIGSAVWGGALWLLSGSRSNPLVRPLANALYDVNKKKGAWVKDRNDGLFAPFPAAFTLVMGVVFLTLGVFTDRALLFVAEGNSSLVLQLAGVSLIGGASIELGRIASGEKMITRDDSERDEALANEFEEFAAKKLVYGQGGSVHRSEVTLAFRRTFAKYRVENDDYPLGDLEIERLLRSWNKRNGNLESISSSGFLKNVKINAEAEIR